MITSHQARSRHISSSFVLFLITLFALLPLIPPLQAAPATHLPEQATPAHAQFSLARQPGRFVNLDGLPKAHANWRAATPSGTFFFSSQGIQMVLPVEFPTRIDPVNTEQHRPAKRVAQRIFQDFLGPQPKVRVTGLDPLPDKVNEYFGDESTWRTGMTTYQAIQYLRLYRGIDLHYTLQDGRLKSTFVIQPGTDPSILRWKYRGVDHLTVDTATGNLVLATTVRLTPQLQTELGALTATTTITLTEHAPTAWQETSHGRVAVPVQFVIGAGNQIRFALGSHDSSLPLTIDPILEYTTVFGGSDEEVVYDMSATQPDGSVVIVGSTQSIDEGSWNDQTTAPPSTWTRNVLVSKRLPQTGSSEWTTYFGGNELYSEGYGITSIANGDQLVVTGVTTSDKFPIIGLPQQCIDGSENMMVAKLAGDTGLLAKSGCIGAHLGSSNPYYQHGGQAIVTTHTDVAGQPPEERLWIAGNSNYGDIFAYLTNVAGG